MDIGVIYFKFKGGQHFMSQRSFKNFVNKHFYNELFSELENYIRFNRSEIELWSNSIDVEHIKGNSLNLEDMTIESIYINGDIQVTTLEFDVCVSVEISFSQTSNRYGDSEDSNIIFKDVSVNAEQIKAGTILIDSRFVDVRGRGAFNNTLMHECVHCITRPTRKPVA